MNQPAAERRSCPFGRHLEYWSACVDPRLAVNGVRIAETRHPSAPSNWPECLTDVLARIRHTRVGRAVVRRLRRRTTIYVDDGRPGALPDPYPLDDSLGGPLRPSPEDFIEARTRGCEAVVVIDPTATAFHNRGGLLSTADVSLFHELAHALAITHGEHRTADTGTARYDAPSREEAYAAVLENMYRDEARYGLRRSYLDHSVIPYGAAPTHPADPARASSGRGLAPWHPWVGQRARADPRTHMSLQPVSRRSGLALTA